MSHPAALPAKLDALARNRPPTRIRTTPWRISGDCFRNLCDALKFDYLKWDIYLGGKHSRG
jgi:hypothetical protein